MPSRIAHERSNPENTNPENTNPENINLVWHFLHRIAVPRRHADLNRSASLDDALTGQTAVALQARSLLNAILFGLARFRDRIGPALNINVAGAARAHSAAGVFDINAIGHGDFQQAEARRAVDSDIVLGLSGEALRLFHVNQNRDCGCGGINRAHVHGRTLEKTVVGHGRNG